MRFIVGGLVLVWRLAVRSAWVATFAFLFEDWSAALSLVALGAAWWALVEQRHHLACVEQAAGHAASDAEYWKGMYWQEVARPKERRREGAGS